MAPHPRKPLSDEELRLRKAGGDYLCKLRENARLSQSELARATDTPYHTIVSQHERGVSKINPDNFYKWAVALRVDPRSFVYEILKYYEPIAHKILFSEATSYRKAEIAAAKSGASGRIERQSLGVRAPLPYANSGQIATRGPMIIPPVRRTTDELQALRKEGGEELQALRQAKGLSQKDLANLLEVQQYTFVSQIETGRRVIPPDKYVVYAHALEVDAKDFVAMLMRYYDPTTYEILFGSGQADDQAN